MSYTYDILKMKAKEVLERAVKMWNEEHDPFYMTSLICGIGRSKVCIEGQEHNVYIVLDVIHEEYRKQPRKEKTICCSSMTAEYRVDRAVTPRSTISARRSGTSFSALRRAESSVKSANAFVAIAEEEANAQ